MAWLIGNAGTIVVLAILVTIVALIIRHMLRLHAQGRSVTCNCGCQECGAGCGTGSNMNVGGASGAGCCAIREIRLPDEVVRLS